MRPSPIGFGLAIATCVACDAGAGDNASTGWGGAMDTLSNGAVVVTNPKTGIWNETSASRLVEDLRIGTADAAGPASPTLFGMIADLAVDAYGRIYVLDSQAKELRIFDADGRHVRTVGGQGSGPGEFEQARGMAWDPDGRLWVVDGRNARYTVFDTTGRRVGGQLRRLNGMMLPWPGAFDRRGRLIDFAFVGNQSVLVRFDTAFEVADTFRLPAHEGESYLITRPDGTPILRMPVPFTARLVWRLDPRGYLWFGTTTPYRILQRTLAGDTVRVVERDYEPVPVTSQDRAAAITRVEERAQGFPVALSRIPNRRPAFRQIFLDADHYVWAAPETSDALEGRLFDVFDPEGRYLGRVRSDVRLALYPEPVILHDAVYAVTTDEQDVPYVVRARIRRVGRPDE